MKIYSCFTGGKLVKKEENKSSSRKIALLFLAFLLFLSCSIYVFQINRIATLGFEIKQKEDKLSALAEKNRQLTIETAQRKAVLTSELAQLNEIKNKSKKIGGNKPEEECFLKTMREPDQTGYLEINIEKAFAMK